MDNQTLRQHLEDAIVRTSGSSFEKHFPAWLSSLPQQDRQDSLDILLLRVCSQVSSFPLFSGTPKMASLLLEAGANPNARDPLGQTPAMRCFDSISFGFEGSNPQTTPATRLLKRLAAHGADFSLADPRGQTVPKMAEHEAFWNHRNSLNRLVKKLVRQADEAAFSAPALQQYAMGFAVSLDGSQVLLLEKNRPAFLAGKWMGVAGHVEPGETPHAAMVREAKEEANLDVASWQPLGLVKNPERPSEIHAFVAFADLTTAQALTDEPIQAFAWEDLSSLRLGNATVELLDSIRDFASRQAPQAIAQAPAEGTSKPSTPRLR